MTKSIKYTTTNDELSKEYRKLHSMFKRTQDDIRHLRALWSVTAIVQVSVGFYSAMRNIMGS